MSDLEQQVKEAVRLSQKIQRHVAENRLEYWKPYPKQLDFLNSRAKIAIMFGGNRVGKTASAGTKVAMHATGLYADWYQGPRIVGPNKQWVIGVTNEQMREAVQVILVGDINNPGTGTIPKNKIKRITKRLGMNDQVDTIEVEHVSGGTSFISLKSAAMGDKVFQGAEIHCAWIDEEVPQEVVEEVDMRLMTTGGQMIMTFTPLKGLTELVVWILEQEDDSLVQRFYMGWDDALHLTESEKDAMRKKYAGRPHELKSRMTGMPSVGRGLIYPFPEEVWCIEPFKLPKTWRRLGGLDVGFTHPTAAVAVAVDDESDTYYVYGDYSLSGQTPPVHSLALKRWGDLDFASDPHSNDIEKTTNTSAFRAYQDHGISVFPANNDVGAGIAEVYQALQEQRLFIFNTCNNLRREMKLYRYNDKNGKIIKKNDDCLDALRYCLMEIAKARVIGQRRRFVEDYKINDWEPFDPYIGV